MFVWTRFLDAGRLVERMLARHLATDHDMSHGEYEILVRVDGAGGSMRLRTLADQVVSSRSKLTHTIDKLCARGWIERRRVAEDGRGVEAIITGAGSVALGAAAIGHAELIREHLLGVWSAREAQTIGRAMDRVSRHLRQ